MQVYYPPWQPLEKPPDVGGEIVDAATKGIASAARLAEVNSRTRKLEESLKMSDLKNMMNEAHFDRRMDLAEKTAVQRVADTNYGFEQKDRIIERQNSELRRKESNDLWRHNMKIAEDRDVQRYYDDNMHMTTKPGDPGFVSEDASMAAKNSGAMNDPGVIAFRAAKLKKHDDSVVNQENAINKEQDELSKQVRAETGADLTTVLNTEYGGDLPEGAPPEAAWGKWVNQYKTGPDGKYIKDPKTGKNIPTGKIYTWLYQDATRLPVGPNQNVYAVADVKDFEGYRNRWKSINQRRLNLAPKSGGPQTNQGQGQLIDDATADKILEECNYDYDCAKQKAAALGLRLQ